MRRRPILAGMVIALGWLLVAAAAEAVEKGPDGKIVMRLAHSSPAGNPTDTAAKKWAELLKERTGGKLEVRVFPNEQLGSEKACLEGAVLGTIDVSLNDAAYVADLYPAAGVFDFPFTFRDWGHYAAMLKDPIFPEVAGLVEKEVGTKTLGLWIYGRRIVNSKRPLRSPADAKGMKIRTPPSELAQENARVLGGIPVTIAFSETYMGLKQGLADAAENPSTAIYDQKWYEVTKYLSLTHHVWNNEILTMSRRAWDSLGPEQQKIVEATSREVGVYRMELQRQLETSRVEDLKKLGMELVVPPSVAPFEQLAQDIKKKYATKYAKYNWAKFHDRVLSIK